MNVMSLLSTLLKEAKSVSLSDGDVERICMGRVRLVTYNSFRDADDIMSFFDPYGCFIVFYSTTSRFIGHWVAVVYNRDVGEINFWDSYGLDDRKILSLVQDLHDNDNGVPALTNLLNTAASRYGLRIVYNRVQFQSSDLKNVATCGRYASLRCRFADLSCDKFNALLKDKRMRPDDLVTLLTCMFSEDIDDLVLSRHKK